MLRAVSKALISITEEFKQACFAKNGVLTPKHIGFCFGIARKKASRLIKKLLKENTYVIFICLRNKLLPKKKFILDFGK